MATLASNPAKTQSDPILKPQDCVGKSFQVVRAKRISTAYGDTHILKTICGHNIFANKQINQYLKVAPPPFLAHFLSMTDFTADDGRKMQYVPVTIERID